MFGSELISLETLNILHGEMLWLEEGRLPIKGKITLDVFLSMPSFYALQALSKTPLTLPTEGTLASSPTEPSSGLETKSAAKTGEAAVEADGECTCFARREPISERCSWQLRR